MAQQMAVEERNSSDNRIGKVHHQIDISLNRYIDRIQPLRAFEPNSVLGVDEKVYLMDMEGMDLKCLIGHPPVIKFPDRDGRHRRVRRAVFSTIDIKALFVFGEMNNEVRSTILYPRNQLRRQRPGGRWRGIEVSCVASGLRPRAVYQVRDDHCGIGISIAACIETKSAQ